MKKLFLSLAVTMLAVALPTAVGAQVINGDLNHSGKLEVSDVTHLINNYLTGTAETISGGADPFTADNARIVGTWWKSPTESITFSADGTTDFGSGYTYKYLPYQGGILFYNAGGIPVSILKIFEATSDYLVVRPDASNDVVVYSRAYVSISQSEYRLLIGETLQLTATAVPSSAGSRGFYWSSSLNGSYPDGAWDADVDSGGVSRGDDGRYYGRSVRPVCQ